MKYNVKTTKRFDKEMIRCQKRGYNMQLIVEAISHRLTAREVPPAQAVGQAARHLGVPQIIRRDITR